MRLFLVLVLIPFIITYVHLRSQLSAFTDDILQVTSSSSTEKGRSSRTTTSSTTGPNVDGVYRRVSSTLYVPCTTGNSFFDLFSLVSAWHRAPTIIKSDQPDQILLFFRDNQWCFSSRAGDNVQTRIACSSGSGSSSKNAMTSVLGDYHPPANSSGSVEDSFTTIHVHGWRSNLFAKQIFLEKDDQASIRTAQYLQQQQPPHPVVEQLVKRPATTFWTCLLVGLAFHYWNKSVPVSAVAKMYENMIRDPFEIWRSLSGATAHFEIWHLFVNCQSLVALGEQLEGNHAVMSSPEFWALNLSLLPMTTAIWLLLQYGSEKYRNSNNNNTEQQRSSPTVGFSGVLFAWMVVASLQQEAVCPIFLLPKLCFRTHKIGGVLPFNWGPFVQLVVLQVILPRVSMSGHLAGILAGYVVALASKANVLVYLQPCLVLPLFHLLYLIYIRKLPARVHYLDLMRGLDTFPIFGYAVNLNYLHMATLAASLFILGWRTPLALAFAIASSFWYLSTVHSDHSAYTKGFIIAAAMVQVLDSMTVAAWLALPTSVWNRPTTRMFFLLLLLRLLTITLSLSVACGKISNTNGIFDVLFSTTIVRPARQCTEMLHARYTLTGGSTSKGTSDTTGDAILHGLQPHHSWGRGHQLGGGGPTRAATTGEPLDRNHVASRRLAAMGDIV